MDQAYQGIRIDHSNQVHVRYRFKGQIIEYGPFESAAAALAACRFKDARTNNLDNVNTRRYHKSKNGS